MSSAGLIHRNGALDLLFRREREEALDLVDPR
jgi:hypothetical protein